MRPHLHDGNPFVKADEHDKLVDVAEAEKAARGTDESRKRVGSTESTAPSDGGGPKGESPTLNHSEEGASGSTGNVAASQVQLTASSIGDTSKKCQTSARGRTGGLDWSKLCDWESQGQPTNT